MSMLKQASARSIHRAAPVARPCVGRGCTKPAYRRCASPQVATYAQRGAGGFDVQFGWPYALLLVELGCVVAHARTPLAIASVLLVIFQTPQDNQFLKTVASNGVFSRYKDAQFFCRTLTAFTFFSFLLVSYLMALSA